ncbi:MAG: cytochrome c1 [Pseudomonas fluorescens]|nr:MAG: cytochrome c1 [Pseudomonas fluorescens]
MMRILTLLTLVLLPLAASASEGVKVPEQKWIFEGLKGTYDKNELLRGYTVATQVCMACHSFKYVSHRDMMRAGFTEAEVQTLAKALNMTIDQKLLTAQDDATAIETFGKIPPDLSLMNKARAGLADYTYAVLTGYHGTEEEIHHAFPKGLPPGASYNKYFPGHAIAMPAPLTGPDMVTYHDGKAATVEQMAHDVTTFMQWTAEPERIERQRLGLFVLLYLVILTALLYASKRTIWKDVKGH